MLIRPSILHLLFALSATELNNVNNVEKWCAEELRTGPKWKPVIFENPNIVVKFGSGVAVAEDQKPLDDQMDLPR